MTKNIGKDTYTYNHLTFQNRKAPYLSIYLSEAYLHVPQNACAYNLAPQV